MIFHGPISIAQTVQHCQSEYLIWGEIQILRFYSIPVHGLKYLLISASNNGDLIQNFVKINPKRFFFFKLMVFLRFIRFFSVFIFYYFIFFYLFLFFFCLVFCAPQTPVN